MDDIRPHLDTLHRALDDIHAVLDPQANPEASPPRRDQVGAFLLPKGGRWIFRPTGTPTLTAHARLALDRATATATQAREAIDQAWARTPFVQNNPHCFFSLHTYGGGRARLHIRTHQGALIDTNTEPFAVCMDHLALVTHAFTLAQRATGAPRIWNTTTNTYLAPIHAPGPEDALLVLCALRQHEYFAALTQGHHIEEGFSLVEILPDVAHIAASIPAHLARQDYAHVQR